MQQLNLNSQAEVFQGVVSELISFGTDDYALVLSGSPELEPLYKHLSTAFGFSFPRHIFMFEELWGEKSQHENSYEKMLRRSGLIGRCRWEKSEFHPVLSANPSNPKVEASGYERELLDILPEFNGKTVLITGMRNDGSFGGILPESEAVESDKSYITYETTSGVLMSATATFMLDNISKALVLVDTAEKCGTFQRISEMEKDVREFPILLFKNIPDVTALCHSS